MKTPIKKYVKRQVQKEIAGWKIHKEDIGMPLDCVDHMELEQLPEVDTEPQNEPKTDQEAELQALGLEDYLD